MEPDERFSNQPMPPRDYSAAYVQELITRGWMALEMAQANLDILKEILGKLQPEVKPF